MEDGEQVSVQGIVTTDTGLWGGEGFYMQDETGGVYVYQNEYEVQPGDVVKLTGSTTTFNGEFELSELNSLEVIGTGSIPEPTVVGPNDISEDNQGELIKLDAVEITDLHKADGYGTTEFTAVNNDGESTVVRLDNRTGTTYDQFPYQNGDVVFITGVSSVFNGTYQIKPRNVQDFTLLSREWLVQSIKESSIQPKGIKNAILTKLAKVGQNPKHYERLIHFIQKQPSRHVAEEAKANFVNYMEALE